jgi:NADPH:quinone reductase-like Zn-dependent oxidoreductase
MNVIEYRGAGGVEVIGKSRRADPAPGPDQVVVRVRAAGLNRADLIQRRGNYPAPPGWPADIPGLEYAGAVEALGPGVGEWRVGDRVMGLVGGGAHAERVVVHRRELLPVPAELSDEEAAAIPEAFLTAYDALTVRGRLRRGESEAG